MTAAFYGNTQLAVGNVIGSNIANIGLILGLAGSFAVIKINKEIHQRDGFLMLLAVLLFYGFAWDGIISTLEAGVMLTIFVAYILFFLMVKRKHRHEFHFPQYLEEFVGTKKKPYLEHFNGVLYAGLDYYAYKELMKGIFYELRRILTITSEVVEAQASAIRYFLKQAVLIGIGIAGLLVGAEMIVQSSMSFPIPSVVIGLILVSIGTSLPELAVAVSAIKKKYHNIMVGNIIGSNIANILFVGAAAAAIRPLQISKEVLLVYLPVLLGFTWLFLVFSRNDFKVNRIESMTFLLFYIAFVLYTFMGPTLGLPLAL